MNTAHQQVTEGCSFDRAAYLTRPSPLAALRAAVASPLPAAA
jgi:hypothetical protein